MTTMYRSRLFSVEKRTIKLRGRNFTFDSIKGPNTVGMLTIMEDGKILLERQYRYSVRRYLYEIPAGHIDQGETAREAAVRELREEAGIKPRSLRFMFRSYPSPGSKTELATFYVATDLVKTKKNREPDELMTLSKVTLKKALEMVRTNQIIDHKTIAAILFYSSFIAR